MMVRVTILAGEADELIGEFEFDQLPRSQEEVSVPWPGDQHGVRIFSVVEVCHLAAGTKGHPAGDGPRTVLRYAEEIV